MRTSLETMQGELPYLENLAGHLVFLTLQYLCAVQLAWASQGNVITSVIITSIIRGRVPVIHALLTAFRSKRGDTSPVHQH